MHTEQQLAKLLIEFINTDSWEESQRFARAYPALLTAEAEVVLSKMMERFRGDEALSYLLGEHRKLLLRAREVGVARAYADFLGAEPTTALGAILEELNEELSLPAQLADMSRRVALCRQALAAMSEDLDPEFWAMLQGELGNSLLQSPLDDRGDNIEQAIHHYELALEVRSGLAQPAKWATTVENLATAYQKRLQGAREENLEQAISLYREALHVRERQTDPLSWAKTIMNLANVYLKRQRGQQSENIEQATRYYQQALQVLPEPVVLRQAQEPGREAESEAWVKTMSNLAGALLKQDKIKRLVGEQSANIEQAIEAYEKVLQVASRDISPITWATTMYNLGNAYMGRIQGEADANIERAIDYYRQSLDVTTRQAMPVEWAEGVDSLANAYQKRFQGEQADNYERAIALYKQALEVRTHQAMPLQWAETMNNLATAILNRVQGKRAENQEQAIGYYKQVLQVRTRQVQPKAWSKTMNNLANAYYLRVRGERADNLEQAIAIFGEALQVRTRETMPLEWAETINNLANAYYDRIRGSRADNLEQAIALHQEALQVTTHQAQPNEWAETMNNLAVAYLDRIRGERAANIEQAIDYYRQALQVRTRQAMPVEWGNTMNNLAIAYRKRLRGVPTENREQAIRAYREALQVRTRQAQPADWADTMNNLAMAYQSRIRGEWAQNQEQAIDCLQKALQVRTSETVPVEWAQSMHNLGIAYFDRVKGLQTDNLAQAIDCYQQALQVTTRQAMPMEWADTMHTLATAYFARAPFLTEQERVKSVEQAIQAYQKALEIRIVTAMPHKHCQTQRNLATLYFQERRWAEAHKAIEAALVAADLLYQASGTTEARQLELREVREVFPQAAYALAKLGRLDEAVTILEQGKARVLRETLTRQEVGLAVLEAATKEDATAFTAARERIKELEAEARAIGQPWARDFLIVSADLRQAHEQLTVVVARIRQYMPEFMPDALSFSDIASLAVSEPLLYLLTTSHGSLALIILPSLIRSNDFSRSGPAETTEVVTTSRKDETCQLEALWIDEFKSDEYDNILYDEKGTARYLHHMVFANTSAQIQAFKQLLDDIWPQLDKLMRPIASRLSELGYQQARLIPTGTLSLLPLHAVCQRLNLTVAPSARALQTAKGKLSQRAPSKPTLLGIGNPLPNPKPLPFARLEVEQIAPLFANQNIYYEKSATRHAIINNLTHTTHLHLSCHGAFDMLHPLNSALHLAGNDTLTLRDLLSGELDLSAARLAVLSACQTGITDFRNVPDEAIGFPAGFLQAGVPGVISTLWPVVDISTALLLTRFYRYHLEDGLAPAMALHNAQKWLRNATTKELGLAEYYNRLFQNARRREEKVEAFKAMRHYQAFPDAKPFAHPYYWAAFVFTGV